ncbi:MAG: hypothetical protein WBZ04_05505 [Candidatus Nanopelagicales bacterium]
MARISGVRVGATAVFTAAATLLVGVGVPANAAPPSPVSPQPAPQSKSVRGDVSAQRGIVVRDLKVSSNRRVVSANVRWNPGLIALKGNRDRFNLRLVAFPDSSTTSVKLAGWTSTTVPNRPQRVRMELSEAQAATLRTATDVVFTASQGYSSPSRQDGRYNRNFVTFKHLSQSERRPASASSSTAPNSSRSSRSSRNCRTVVIRSGADLSGCDFAGSYLKDLVLKDSDVNNSTFAGSVLTGIASAGLTGSPRSLPTGWYLTAGRFTKTAPPVPVPTCAEGGACVVGDTGPGGGTVFYAAPTRQDWGQYLEVAPMGWQPATTDVDPTTGMPNFGRSEGVSDVDPRTIFGCMDVSVGILGSAIGTGLTNTQSWLAVQACTLSPVSAAIMTGDYVSASGKDDWFLPSPDELNQLCRFARQQDTASTDPCDSTGSLRSDFATQDPMWYWSSSENPFSEPNQALGQCFLTNEDWCITGEAGAGNKDAIDRAVRPIREF